MYKYSLTHGIGPGERNGRRDLAAFGKKLERAAGLDPWLPHAWPMAAFPEARTSDGYTPGFGGALRGFQILAGLDPDGVARRGGPTERALDAALDPARPGRTIDADEVYRGAAPGTGSVGRDRPADGGVKAAAKIRKLAHKAGTAQADAGRARDGGALRPLSIPTVPPPRIRRPVGAGGVNDRNDLLQARRNLARVGYAPRLRGVGEPAAMHGAAVRNGLLAYQQARGLKADGLMRPGGETERALHRQIAVQQQRLKDQAKKDAAKARRDLATVSGTVRNADAETLGARYTGAAFDKQRSEAYAETLDRMKRGHRKAGAETDAPAIAVTGSADKTPGEIRIDENPDAATAGTETKPPEGVAARSIPPATTFRAARLAEAQKRAEADRHAGLGDIEHEAERRERERRQRAADRAFRLGRDRSADAVKTMRRGLDIAIEHGALPRNYRPWLERTFGPRASSGSPETYLAALDRLNALRERRRAVFDTLPARLRTAVAVHRHIESTYGGIGADGELAAASEARRRRTELIQGAVDDLHRPDVLKNLGIAADWLPVIGEVKSGVEALIALRNHAAARRRGDEEAAARYGEEAAWGLAGLVPVLSYSRKGRKLLKLLAAPVTRLNAKAGREFARKVEETVFGRIAAQRRLAIFEGNWEHPSIKKFDPQEVFGDSLKKMTPEDREEAIRLLRFAKGSAAEKTVDRTMRRAGFETSAEGSGRAVRIEDKGVRIYDIGTPHKVKSVAGLFLAPRQYKGTVKNGKITVVEVRSDLAQGTSKQKAKDEAVKKAIEAGNLPEVLTTNGQQVVADLRLFRVPIHQIDKDHLVESVRDMLGGRFGRQTIDDLAQDIEAFHRRSRDGDEKPFGIVMLYLAARLRLARAEN